MNKNNPVGKSRFSQILKLAYYLIVFQLIPFSVFADCENNFVSLKVARAYLQKNPYIIAFYSILEGQSSYLFKVDNVYMQDENMMVSGPVILIWDENSYRQRNYHLPDSGQIFTDELCANYHFGYYEPMRAAFPLANLLRPAGGIYNYYSAFWAFPEPDIITDLGRENETWSNHPPSVIQDYFIWWDQYASQGPPVLSELIDSVLSAPEGGNKIPPKIYVDYDICPGEGCTYGKWKSNEYIAIYDRPDKSKKIGTIDAGQEFTAITGKVYAIPKEEIASVSLEVYDSTGSMILEPGRRFYILSNTGEGHSKVWVNGRIMILPESPYNTSQEWWVEIKTVSGRKGWILYPESGCIMGSDYLE